MRGVPLDAKVLRHGRASNIGLRTTVGSGLIRFAARARGRKLDDALAAGTDPGDSVILGARTRWLTTERNRLRLVAAIEEVLQVAELPPTMPSSVVPLATQEVRIAAPQLRCMAQRLRGEHPVGAGGVAALQNLITDSASPLYAPARDRELIDRLAVVSLALDGRLPRR